MKKLLALLLTFVLMFSFVPVTAFANENTGTITIQNVNEGTKYRVYKILDLESVSGESPNKVYNYQIIKTIKETNNGITTTTENPWFSFWNGYPKKDSCYEITRAADIVEEKEGKTITKEVYSVRKLEGFDAEAADFAKAALAYADKNTGIDPIATERSFKPVEGTSDVMLSNLPWGYYLVDSSVGALCALRTTEPNAVITIKNNIPTVEKTVEEDSIIDSNAWLATNSADIGQPIKFDVTIKAQPGAENYIYHDKMENMTLLADYSSYPFTVIHHQTDSADQENNRIILEEGVHYVLNTDIIGHEGSFEIVFKQEFCDTIEANDKIYIKYAAKLNPNAIIADESNKHRGNTNTGYLTFGGINGENQHKSNEAVTTTYTYGVDVVKTDDKTTKLSGAVFQLLGSDHVTPVKLVAVNDDTQKTYRVYDPATDDNGVEDYITEFTIVENEDFYNFTVARIVGLDNGKYYLRETNAPEGYSQLAQDREISVSDYSIEAKFDTMNNAYISNTGIHIVNNAGTSMPETGGTGTVMFVTFGSLAAIGTGVLLITKKRMSMFED